MKERKYWLEKGYSEEQTTEILNELHESSKGLQRELENVKALNVTYANDNATMKTRLDEIDKNNMTEQQKIDKMLKDAEKKLRESEIILNTSKAKEILSSIGLVGDELEEVAKSIVTNSEETTIKNANNIANVYKNMREQTIKKTKEEIANINLKPNNKDKDNDDSGMDYNKFQKLTYNEQKKFKDENPEAYKNLIANK